MNNTQNRKKALLLLVSYLIIIFTPKRNKNKEINITYNPEYQTEKTVPYASYSDKSVYIIRDNQLTHEMNPHDVYVFDSRNIDNSTMLVWDSYKIKNKQEIEAILNILLNYEQEYPSIWNRTFTSMEKEWLIHNICYFLNYEQNRTKHVDLDNADEEDFANIVNILSRLKEIIDIGDDNQELKTHTLKK